MEDTAIKHLKETFIENRSKRVLDIGTGVGNFIFLLNQLEYPFEEIIGIDTSQRAIDMAKNYLTDQKNVKLMVMDGNHQTFSDELFDVVTLSNSLHHLDDMTQIHSA